MLRGALLFTVNVLEKKLPNGMVINSRYKVKDFLGRGSYGSSYLVYDTQEKSQVVLKLLRVHRRWKKSGRLAFEHEQELLKEINHPYFPKFFEKGEYNSKPYFTMEYVNGKTFEELIFEEGKVYGEKEAFQIGLELLKMMEWLHDNGIIHRDIRIPNVMLCENRLRLIDFGLARRFEKKKLGPFSLNQIKRILSPISDFYALGHFLLFLLYSSYEVKENEQERSWEDELDISIQAKGIIRKLLAIDEPYQSCQEIAQDVMQLT
ncbi:serine/threonine protein kinase [Bacillus tuaregi]|uniref:serine/threonine protein kinase n=1 Tax=Bacillus tuaregi TaxID=1816695 RepID=UPI0008F8DB19|nr:protein kinase [Bacillus tuaregi]